MDGSSSLVSRTGPKRFVQNSRSNAVGRHLLDGSYRGDAGVVDEDVGRTYRLLDGFGGSDDRRRVIEVESNADQAAIIGGRARRRPQAFESHVG
jgi:hypothetical protein